MRSIKSYLLIITVTFFGLISTGFSETPKEIMRSAIDRDDGKTQVTRLTLSSCRYSKKNRKLVCTERPRVKIMEGIRKDFGPDQKDSKLITILLEPASERGIGFLQFDYDDIDKETDQWIYLSALGKVKRIISGNEYEPRDGSFFGTEFNYEDMESRNLKNCTYKLLAEEKYQGRDCWVIESIPTSRWSKRSNYSKTLDWIDKERFLFLKTILYNRQVKRVKRITNYAPEKVNGIWIQRKRLMNNMETRRMTRLTIDAVVFNVPVRDDFLTLRTLTDKAFREKNIKKFRKSLK
ncbi:MAG: outer membrane lipoprotein-sorting protein [Desulfobacterales bacterium]|nr:outer membrane lipoprotein-sorting protein [Desulfobacterales bacterium]